jgi:hypothetical protein
MTTTAARTGQMSSASHWMRREFNENPLVYMLMLGFFTLACAVSLQFGDSVFPHLGKYAERVLKAVVVVAAGGLVATGIVALLQKDDPSPLRYMARRYRAAIGAYGSRILFSFAILAAFMAAFLYFKMKIPYFHPYGWDETLAAWDRTLFFGYDAWEVMQPVIGYGPVTRVIDFFYMLWVPMVFIFWGWTFVDARVERSLRQRYWLATILIWIIGGVVLATVFSSAGPCYYPAITGVDDPSYRRLMTYLQDLNSSSPIYALEMQDFLWLSYTGAVSEPGGISAAPSLHNAQAVLFALVAYRFNKWFGHVMAAFAVLIFVGSVHLGWHYAVDGIMGAVVALAVWNAVGYFAFASRVDRSALAQPLDGR